MVLARFEASGTACRQPLWLLSCMNWAPSSRRMMAAMMPVYVWPRVAAAVQAASWRMAPMAVILLIPRRGTYLPIPLAAMAPTTPQSPSRPTVRLPAWNGSPARWKAMQDQMLIMLPKVQVPRKAYRRMRGWVANIFQTLLIRLPYVPLKVPGIRGSILRVRTKQSSIRTAATMNIVRHPAHWPT